MKTSVHQDTPKLKNRVYQVLTNGFLDPNPNQKHFECNYSISKLSSYDSSTPFFQMTCARDAVPGFI